MTKRTMLFSMFYLVIGLGLSTGLAQEVVVEDTLFGSAPVELGLSIPMGQRYTKDAFLSSSVPTTVRALRRTQVMSNRPEQVSGTGVLYRGRVAGTGSVYFYHVNSDLEPRHFAVALRNPGSERITVTVTALGVAFAKQYGYRYGGQEVALEVFSEMSPRTLTLEPDSWGWLEPELAETPVAYKDGASMHAEFSSTGEVEVLVVSLDEGARELDGLEDFGPHESGAGRGTFPEAERELTVSFELGESGEQRFAIATGEDWVFGRDELEGVEAQNRGNYGVVYHVAAEVTNAASEGRLVRLYMVNIGCVISGALRTEEGQVFKLPKDLLGVLDVNDYGILIGQLALEAGATDTYRFDFTPPGFSCLPVGVVARSYAPDEVD